MSFISKSSIQEVNERLDAIAVVQDYVRLEKKGGRWWGKCPFHGGGQEKTPSFKVDPDFKTYHCFGCSKGGGIINFVMEMDKLAFPEAVKNLARKFGIELVYEDGTGEESEKNTRQEELLELYRRTLITFQHFLLKKSEGSPALHYILSRGITEQMVERFRLGFAPQDKNFLYNFLKGKGYSEDFLDKSGLFSSRYKALPLFSGRLMFPITDRQGRVVAFGGRALPGALQSDGKEPPKYINSPEIEIYKKSQTLFAMDLALPQIRQTKTVYIAEGYLDVIALHQAGITNAVAPLGTAFTGEQVKLLGRWAENAVLAFDSDEAGQTAAFKAILTCRKNGLSCAVVWPEQAVKAEPAIFSGQNTGGLPKNGSQLKDPADILQKFGPQALNKIAKYYITDFEYLIFRGRSLFDVSMPDGKNRALAFLFPYLETLGSEIEKDSCIVVAADAFGVDRDAVHSDYAKHESARHTGKFPRQEVQGKPPEAMQNEPVRMNGELFPLIVVSVNPSLYPEFRKALEIKEVEDPFAKELFVALEECFVNDENSFDDLLTRIKSGPLRDFIISRGASPEFKGAPRRLMEDGINEIKKKRLRRRLAEIGVQLRNCERKIAGGAVNTDELLAEKMALDLQIRKLTEG